MLFLGIFWDMIIQLFQKHPEKIVVGVTVAFVGGYAGIYLAPEKHGIILHDQGYELQDPDGDNMYNLWIGDKGVYSSKSFDIWDDPRDCAEWVAQVGIDRFGRDWGCSYVVQCWGDSAFQFQPILARTAHAKGWNSISIGVMLARTDNPEYNYKTLRTFTDYVYPMIEDSLAYFVEVDSIDYGSIDFCLFHFDVATNGKTDPRPFKKALEDEGFRFDNRPFPQAIEIIPYDYPEENTGLFP